MSGKAIRLKRLFKHSDRLLVIPLDHGITIGPVKGLENLAETVQAVADGGADAVILHKGYAQTLGNCLNFENCELILHLSASTALAPDPNRKELVASVERALELGATAVSVHVNLGSTYEAEMLRDCGVIAEQSSRWGMPLLAMMYIRDNTATSEFDPVKIRHAARVAEELGADLVKVNYSGDAQSFAQVIEGVTIPVIIAGGPKMESSLELLEMVSAAVAVGAKGVAFGRNVFQAAQPTRLVKVIRQLLDQKVAQPELEQLLRDHGLT